MWLPKTGRMDVKCAIPCCFSYINSLVFLSGCAGTRRKTVQLEYNFNYITESMLQKKHIRVPNDVHTKPLMPHIFLQTSKHFHHSLFIKLIEPQINSNEMKLFRCVISELWIQWNKICFFLGKIQNFLFAHRQRSPFPLIFFCMKDSQSCEHAVTLRSHRLSFKPSVEVSS